jgi:hypothetical protein
MTKDKTNPVPLPTIPDRNWCIILIADNLFIIGGYRPLAVELLKTVVPGGARRFHRRAESEFFAQFPLTEPQTQWLQEARLFNATWEILREYRRTLLNVLALEYSEVWLVEAGQSHSHQLPEGMSQSEALQYTLGSQLIMPLTWARSYTLYCHRHRTWEAHPCKEAGVIAEVAPPDQAKPKKWPDLELHAPHNTLLRASRQQVSYYLAAEHEPLRLGRDDVGEAASRRVIQAQRLALTLRAARAMTAPPAH